MRDRACDRPLAGICSGVALQDKVGCKVDSARSSKTLSTVKRVFSYLLAVLEPSSKPSTLPALQYTISQHAGQSSKDMFCAHGHDFGARNGRHQQRCALKRTTADNQGKIEVRLPPRAVQVLTERLRQNATLTSLDLSSNPLKSEGASYISKVRQTTLKGLGSS